MRIGEYIKYKRHSLGYSQNQLAERLEISKQAVSKWETGTALPDVMIIPDIAYALNVKPEFLMKIIWTGETGEYVDHFVSVNVKESDGSSYSIQIYRIDDFIYAKEIFDKICNGQIESVMQALLDYYTYDTRRSFTVKLSEAVYYEDDELPHKSLLIESRKIDSLVKSYAQSPEDK